MVGQKLKASDVDPILIHNAKTLRQKLDSMNSEIGLTDSETTLLVFTSLDVDWFTNLLILAGEFTKWFNIDFSGDSREEIDFRDNKAEIWKAATAYA